MPAGNTAECFKIVVAYDAAHLPEVKRVKKRFARHKAFGGRRIKATLVPFGSAIIPFARKRIEFRVGAIMKVAVAQTIKSHLDAMDNEYDAKLAAIATEAKSILEELFPMLSVVQSSDAPVSTAQMTAEPGRRVTNNPDPEPISAGVVQFMQAAAMKELRSPEQIIQSLLDGDDQFRDDDPLDVLCRIIADDFTEKLNRTVVDPGRSDNEAVVDSDKSDRNLLRSTDIGPQSNCFTSYSRQASPHSSPLDFRFNFDSFVVGESNRAAFRVAKCIAKSVISDQYAQPPAFCFRSDEGMGKTHLLQAMAWSLGDVNDDTFSAYSNVSHFSHAVRSSRSMHDFLQDWLAPTVVMIDDIDTLDGPQLLDYFEALVSTRCENHLLTVVSATHPPNELGWLKNVLDKLAIYSIGPFEKSVRQEILEKAVRRRQNADSRFFVYSDALDLLADHFGSNGRDLDAAVSRLFAYWTETGEPITSDDVKAIVGQNNPGTRRQLGIRDISLAVSAYFGEPQRNVVISVQPCFSTRLAIYLANQLTAMPLPEIGFHFGRMAHVAVRDAIDSIQAAVARDESLGETIRMIKVALWNLADRSFGQSTVASLLVPPASSETASRTSSDASNVIQPAELVTDTSIADPDHRRPLALSARVTPDIIEGRGVVKWFDVGKGYGFIRHDNGLPDALLHVQQLLAGGYGVVHEGARIRALLRQGGQGLRVMTILDLDPLGIAGDAASFSVAPAPGIKRERAIVKWFNSVAGFGFLTRGPGTPDIFCHRLVLRRAGLIGLVADQVVEVCWSRGPKGCVADWLRPISADQRTERAGSVPHSV